MTPYGQQHKILRLYTILSQVPTPNLPLTCLNPSHKFWTPKSLSNIFSSNIQYIYIYICKGFSQCVSYASFPGGVKTNKTYTCFQDSWKALEIFRQLQ